jgi:hypothetical protein
VTWLLVAAAVLIAYWVGQYRGYRQGVRLLMGPPVRAGQRLGELELAKLRCRCGAFQKAGQ